MLKDQEINALVEEVLDNISERKDDIVDQVFLAVEGNPNLLERYNQLVDAYGKNPVDAMIGRHTREITGFQSSRKSRRATSSLVTRYTVLLPDETTGADLPEAKEITIKIEVKGEEEATAEVVEEPASAAASALKKVIERAAAEEFAGRDLVEEYESKYYGVGDRQKEPTPETPPPPPPPATQKARRKAPLPPPPPFTSTRYAAPDSALTTEKERLWAAISHACLMLTLVVSVFSMGMLFPVLIFAPMVIYFVYRNRSEFVAYHALQGFALQLLATIGWAVLGIAITLVLVILIIVSAVLSILLIGIPLLLVCVLALIVFWIVWIFMPLILAIYGLMAAWAVYNGRDFRYVWLSNRIDRYMSNNV